MTIYLVQVFLILLMSAGLHPASNEKGKRRFLFLSFALLTIVSGIRGYTVGADTKVYVRWYENIDYIAINNGRFEAGFTLFMKALHKISSNPSFLLFISSIVCIGTFCVFANRYSKKPTISVLLYVLLGSYFSQMNIMRQSLALSITMWSFMLILDDREIELHSLRRVVISALLILLATSFHTIAAVCFIAWVLLIRQGQIEDKTKLTMQWAVMRMLLIAGIFFVAYSVVMRLVIAILPWYANYFYGTWSDSNYFASLFKMLISVVFLIVGSFVLRGRKLTNAQRFSVIMLGLNIVFQVLAMRMEIWGRIASLFGIYTYLLWVPEFLNEIQLRNNRRIIEFAITGFSFLYMLIVLVFRPEWTLVVPYVIK
ncbi:EpsG family protein [Sarcina sp. DSM 11001]|uniref:EpsG family protein n=1 Tax=Sarcina sp. DSM 11001 TaxID=1798184 RepID=UPI00087FB437|nr:EpsG family protein [Sarcina sp. DSM 11001]SDK24453.1 EpsG family protein [Sarcina sp. DSM 11001]